MKFLSKYELGEHLVNGRIAVFKAKDLHGGEQRLIHVVEMEDAGEISKRQILLQIRRWIAEPPGEIIEGGRYLETSYAYLITSLPADPKVVLSWLQTYLHPPPEEPEAAAATHDLGAELHPAAPITAAPIINEVAPSPVDPHAPALQAAEPEAELPEAKPPEAEPGDFTKLFKLGSLPPPPVPAQRKAGREEKPVKPAPGNFTREFDGPSDNHVAKPSRADDLRPFSAGGSHTSPKPQPPDLFADFKARPNKPEPAPLNIEPPADVSDSRSKTGEFTQFFRTPGQRSQGLPGLDSNDLYRPAENRRLPSVPDLGISNQHEVRDIFEDPAFRKRNEVASNHPPGNRGLHFQEPSMEDELAASSSPPIPKFDRPANHAPANHGIDIKGRDHVPSADPLPRADRPFQLRDLDASSVPEPVWDRPSGKPEAAQPMREQIKRYAPEPPPIEAGPSEYTVIVRSLKPPPPGPEEKQNAGGAKDAHLPAVRFSAPPAPPAANLHVPPVPAAPVIATPKLAAPNIPAAPAAPRAPKAPSFLPVIIVVNAVLLLAIAMVIYFLIRSH